MPTHVDRRKVEIGSAGNVSLSLLSDPPGFVKSLDSERVRVCIHVGPPVFMDCRHGSTRHRGTAIYGDVDIIPANIPATWELKGVDIDLMVYVNTELVQTAAMDSGKDLHRLEIRSRFQARDSQIEHIGWALKTEMESGFPSGRLYTESLGTALAARIVGCHSSFACGQNGTKGGIPHRKLREVLSYIEENLSRDIALRQIADVAGLSISHFKSLFRQSVGIPAHQYLIRRRVERAIVLLRQKKLPITQIALETGFCHQSHLAKHMRRILGVPPRKVRANLC
jgi:AraC family transcriptional regulator